MCRILVTVLLSNSRALIHSKQCIRQNVIPVALLRGPDTTNFYKVRCISTSSPSSEKPSSKIEESVQHLKKKKEIKQEIDHKDIVPKPDSEAVVPKKTIWQKFVDELKHYYSGFKLLFIDIRVSTKIAWKVLQGQSLSRRESRQLVRTTSDLFRLVPFSVFVIVPFMELLLPFALKLFPGMLPSTFTTSSEREAKMKRTLVAKLEYAKFLQKTLDEMAPVNTSSRSSRSARDFVNFYNKIKTSDSTEVDTDEILKFSKLFEDEITLDNMTRSQLAAICRLLELTPIGTTNFLILQIEMRLRHLIADDKLIMKEGLRNLTIQELQVACKERGMRSVGISEQALRKQMKQWLDLSQNAKVPPSLLLLSRTLYLPETLEPSAKIAATISALPESAASATTAQIGEREGKIRNVVRLEQILEEQRKIEAEAAEQLQAAKQAAQAIKIKMPEIREVKDFLYQANIEKAFFDKAPILVDKALNLSEQNKSIDPSGLDDLKTAVDILSQTKSQVKDLEALKKELSEYEEDLKDLDKLKEKITALNLSESRGAKRLFAKVNHMLGQMDTLLAEKERAISKSKEIEGKTDEELEYDDKTLVTIQELLEAVKTLQRTPDSSKLEQIAEVLSLMDVDADGMIKIDHVQKTLELLGTEQAHIPAKQLRQIVDMLSKEEMLEVEKNLELLLNNERKKTD